MLWMCMLDESEIDELARHVSLQGVRSFRFHHLRHDEVFHFLYCGVCKNNNTRCTNCKMKNEKTVAEKLLHAL